MIVRTLLLLVFLTHSISIQSEQPLIVGYLPEYRIDDVEAEQLKPLTDVIYFGLTPPTNVQEFSPVISEAALTKLKEIKREADCRLLVCVGGWNRSDNFAALAANPRSRRTFISRLTKFCNENDFDGVDFDWEHPKNAEEIRNYARLLQESRAAFRKSKLLVTVAQAGWQDLGKAAYTAVNRVHLMAYDHRYPQASLQATTADVDRILKNGCPQQKVVLGVPFYGRNVDGAARTYRDLSAANSKAPEKDVIDGFAFNGPRTISKKVELVSRRNLAGVMIWEVGQDSPATATSLLSIIAREISRHDQEQR